MPALEWIHSRPYYLDSSTTAYDFLWGGLWFLFDGDDYDNMGHDLLNLGIWLSINVDIDLAEYPEGIEPGAASGFSKIGLSNRFRIDRDGNVEDPSPEQSTYRYSTDDGRVGIPFQLFNLNTVKTYTQLAGLNRRESQKVMNAAPPASGSLQIDFEYVILPDRIGPDLPDSPIDHVANPFLIQEMKHPGWIFFVGAPDENWQSDPILQDRFSISAQWDASIDFGLSVKWITDADLAVGPNRYERSAEFPGEKYYA